MLTPFEGPKVLLFEGNSLVSTAIRWQTRGRFSHAALMRRDGRILEAWHRGGVRMKRLTNWKGVHAFEIPSASDEQWDQALRLAFGQIGKPYDWRGVLRFVSRKPHHVNGAWFCSELVFECLARSGVRLLDRIEASDVSPQLLSYSTLLEAV